MNSLKSLVDGHTGAKINASSNRLRLMDGQVDLPRILRVLLCCFIYLHLLCKIWRFGGSKS
jgi:hypothetical protein